jgi:murein L,D-transpeptidase YcbB/YkuD
MLRLAKNIGLIVLLLSFSLGTVHASLSSHHIDNFAVPLVDDPVHDFSLNWSELERFYDGRDGLFAWHDGEQLNASGRQLFDWLSDADAEGLNLSDYHVDHLKHLVNSELPDYQLLRELLLTDGYLRLARDLRYGHLDPKTTDPLWLLPNDLFDPVEILTSALQEDRLAEALKSLSPKNESYVQLRQALQRYRKIHGAGGWPILAFEETLRPGERHDDVMSLRIRFAFENNFSLSASEDPQLFDDELVWMVKRFQRRFGIYDDGVVGPKTLQALNVPVETRISQILVNLERWRWLPHELESNHVWVNTAGFDIRVKSQDQVVFNKRTINGREERQTPSFNSRITHLVVNPTWTVPRSIAIKDLLPKQQADVSFLPNKRIRVYQRNGQAWDQEVDPTTIDWSLYHEDYFPFILRQDAGQGNSLGRVKFHMPNKHAIFLHDTPSVGLFNRPARAFSSGCVRVEHADDLARLLMQDAGENFDQALDSGETLTSPLAEPIPIYLTYFTSWVDSAGDVHFRPDIYHRNANLMLALEQGMGRVTAQRDGSEKISSL